MPWVDDIKLIFPFGHYYLYLSSEPLHIIQHVVQESVPTESLAGSLLLICVTYVKSYQVFLCICYGLNMCVPTKPTCWNPNGHGDGMRKWDIWEYY